MERVSILIPTYNGARFISECVESALNQTYANVEVVVIDDGSTDGTADILQKYESRIVLLRQENQGLCGALNSGLNGATGDFVSFLGHDDYIMAEKIEKQVRFLESHPEYGMVYTDGIGIDKSGATIRETYNRGTFRQGRVFPELFVEMFVSGPTMMIPRPVIEKVGHYDTAIAFEDYQMALRISYYYPIGYIEDKLYAYRQHGSNMSSRTYTMSKNNLLTIAAIAKEFPDIKAIVGPKVFRNRLADLHYGAGRVEMEYRRDFGTARRYLWSAMKYRPHLRTAVALLSASLGIDLVTRTRETLRVR
jgi:glycosyltransferase involved in cell wall biosynthesis